MRTPLNNAIAQTDVDMNNKRLLNLDASTLPVPSGGQPLSATLTTLSSASAYFLTLSDDANAAAVRTTLGLGTMATQDASAVAITGGTLLGVSKVNVGGVEDPGAGYLRALNGIGIGGNSSVGRLTITSNAPGVMLSSTQAGTHQFGWFTGWNDANSFSLINENGDQFIYVSTAGGVNIGGTSDPGAGNLFIQRPTANLYLKDTSTGWQSASSGIITPQANNSLRSTAFTSGVTGWNINAAGDAEFLNGTFRGELRSSVFKVNEIAATAGTFGVFYSAANLTTDFTTPASTSSSFSFTADNSDAGGMLFGVNDIVRFKSWTGAGVSDAWATITARVNNGTNTTYTATLNSGSTSATFRAGTAVVDYGPSGTGFITLSTDGTVGATPNMTMATHAGTPWSGFTTLLRTGNLSGSYGYAVDTYGLGLGQYGAAQSWLTFDTSNGIRIGNNTTTLSRWYANGDLLIGETGAGKENLFLSGGALNLRNNVTSVLSLDSTNGLRIFGSGGATIGQWDLSGNATFGQVATSKANLYWNNSNQRVEYRGSTNGTTVQSYVDTDGAFVSGGGLVKLNSNGISLDSTTAGSSSGYSRAPTAKDVRWFTGATTTAGASSNYFAGDSTSVTEVRSIASSADGHAVGRLRSSTNASETNYLHLDVHSFGSSAGDQGYISIYGNSGHLTGVTIGSTFAPTQMLDVYGTGKFSGPVIIGSSAPASAAAAGTAGTVTWDASYIYVCTATNTWKRVAIATW